MTFFKTIQSFPKDCRFFARGGQQFLFKHKEKRKPGLRARGFVAVLLAEHRATKTALFSFSSFSFRYSSSLWICPSPEMAVSWLPSISSTTVLMLTQTHR